MLTPVTDCPALVVCTSCRGGGGVLARALHAAKAGNGAYAGIAVQEMACLFACGDGCAVHLRAPGKIGYVMGRFAADADSARALLDYAAAYADSAIGEVPYAQWPDGVKGHFIARTPPPGFVIG